MKKVYFRAACALLLGVLCLPAAFPVSAAGANRIHAIGELNTDPVALDDHAGETIYSAIETNFRASYTLNAKDLGVSGYLWYPRIKKLGENEYILFFQNGRWGPNVYFCKSTDGKNWGKPNLLFQQKSVEGRKYLRNYATCDAILLQNGDLVAAAIFHPVAGTASPSRFNMEERGIVVRISHDHGESWTEEKIVYHSRVWEPSFLQLPNGDLQMYLTHSGPKDAIFQGKMGNEVSSGIAMLVSKDNGVTWEPDALSYPYEATRIVQQKIYDYNGIAIMTDQMPVAVLLHDGKTIAMVAESKWPAGGHRLSIIRSHDFFATELEMDAYGPSDRSDNLLAAAGPYLAQFPSGEILVSLFAGKQMPVYLANETATKLYTSRAFYPAGKGVAGLWGSIEVTGTHTALISTGDVIIEPNVVNNLRTNGLAIAEVVLNHRIDARRAAITVDGRTEDWAGYTDALFVGSVSQAQATFRFTHDEETLWLLCERLDRSLEEGDSVTITLAKTRENNQLKLTFDHEGLKSAMLTDEKGRRAVPVGDFLQAAQTGGSGDTAGIAYELAVPLSLLNFAEDEEFCLFVQLKNTDNGKRSDTDQFDGSEELVKATWPRVRLTADGASEVPDPPVSVETTVPPVVITTEAPDPAETTIPPAELPAPASTNRGLLIGCIAAVTAAVVAVIAALVSPKGRKKP